MVNIVDNNYKRIVTFSKEVESADIDTVGKAALSNSEGSFLGTEEIADGTYNLSVDIDGAGAADISTGALADTSGIAEISNAGALLAFTGATASGLGAADYDLDIQVDQENSVATWAITITVAGTEDWDAIAALIQTALQTASDTSPTITITANKFLISSVTVGDTSRIIITAGTAGSGGGDLLAAITALSADYTATIDTPVDGVETTIALAIAGIDGNLTGASIAIVDGEIVVSSDTDGPASTIVLAEGSSSGFIAAMDAISGVTTVIETPIDGAGGQMIIALSSDGDKYDGFVLTSFLVRTSAFVNKSNGLIAYYNSANDSVYITDGSSIELAAGDIVTFTGFYYNT